MTKLKGDIPVGAPVSIKDAKGKDKGESSKQGEAESTVKEEPKDFEEGEGGGEGEEGEADGADGDFGNYDGGDFGPGGDEIYGEVATSLFLPIYSICTRREITKKETLTKRGWT